MMIFGIVGRVLILLALVILGMGLWLWFSGADIGAPAGKLWFTLDHASLNLAQVVVQRHLHLPGLWQDVILPFLLRPAWEVILWLFIATMTPGGVLVYLGRRRQHRRYSFRD